MDEKPIIVSRGELAKICGKSVSVLEDLTAQGVIQTLPSPTKKRAAQYDLVKTMAVLINHYSERAQSKFIPKDIEEARKKQIETRTEIDEIKLAILRGDVHTTENIEQVFGAMLTRLRVNLLGIPMNVAPMLSGKEDVNSIAKIIDDRIRRSLIELSSFTIDDFKAYSGAEYEAVTEECGNDGHSDDTE